MQHSAFDGVVPPHFYGEMSKTELGCQVLSEKGHFAEFSHFIRQHGLESEDLELILKLKSILWAVVSHLTHSLPNTFTGSLVSAGQCWRHRRWFAIPRGGRDHSVGS